jgi:hypothetical protein
MQYGAQGNTVVLVRVKQSALTSSTGYAGNVPIIQDLADCLVGYP